MRLRVQEWPKPRDISTRGHEDLRDGRVLVAREVARRRPRAHILGVPAELFEAESAVRSREHVHAVSPVEGLMAGQHGPRSIETRRHYLELTHSPASDGLCGVNGLNQRVTPDHRDPLDVVELTLSRDDHHGGAEA